MSSKSKNTNYHTLAIIGNGFDLNHDYKTRYYDFSQSTNDLALKNFKSYCENEKDSITNWYDFEENVSKISTALFSKQFEERNIYGNHLKEIESEIDKFNLFFKKIHYLFIEYLEQEISKKEIVKKSSVEHFLNNKAIALNFNYTNIVEEYTNNVIYIHGSLKEKDIILGYDYRDEPCLAQYSDMKWSKNFCRDALSFRRILRTKYKLENDSEKYQSLISDLEKYFSFENDGRGIDDERGLEISNYNFIKNILHDIRKHSIPDIDYKQIKNLVILGHGIKSDKVFLKKIVSACENLNEITIFRYNEEEDLSFKNKLDFFLPYCDNISTEYY